MKVVINNFTTPEDTPEHNRFQVAFLKKSLQTSAALALHPYSGHSEFYNGRCGCGKASLEIHAEFEINAWDVILHVPTFRIYEYTLSYGQPHDKTEWAVASDKDRRRGIESGCDYYALEIKPTIADNWPHV